MLIVLDWDGTLCDSIAKITACMQSAASALNMPVPAANAVRDIVGLGLPEAVAVLFPEAVDSDLSRIQKAYSSHFIAQDKEPSPLFEGVEQTLCALKDSGHIVTIATGKSRRGLDRIMASMGWVDFFHGSRCADETASKPHPLMLEELLAEFSCEPGEALMVGDTEFDMEMAVRAGMPRVGVSYGAHSAERLNSYDLKACIDEFPALLKYV